MCKRLLPCFRLYTTLLHYLGWLVRVGRQQLQMQKAVVVCEITARYLQILGKYLWDHSHSIHANNGAFCVFHDSKQFRSKNVLITKKTFNVMELKQIFDFTGLFHYFCPEKGWWLIKPPTTVIRCRHLWSDVYIFLLMQNLSQQTDTSKRIGWINRLHIYV